MSRLVSPVVYFVIGALVVGGISYGSLMMSFYLFGALESAALVYVLKLVEVLIITALLYWLNLLLYRIEKNKEYRFRHHFRQSFLFYLLFLAPIVYMSTSGPHGLEIFGILMIAELIFRVALGCIVANAAFILSNVLLNRKQRITKTAKSIIIFVAIALSFSKLSPLLLMAFFSVFGF